MNKIRLFSVGPVNMYQYSLDLAAKQIPYFRTSEFSNVVYKVTDNLRQLLGADKGTQIALLTASGSGAMEAVVNTLSRDKKVLVICGGSFGDRFVNLLRLTKVPFDTIDLAFEENLTAEKLRTYDNSDYSALLVNIHETSIGKYYSPHLLREYCQRNNCYLIVDAISSFLADSYDMSVIGADVTILSSQKALALYPGLSMIAVNDRYYRDRIEGKVTSCAYLDINTALIDARRGQTPYTPALDIIYQMNQRTEIILADGGAQVEVKRAENIAKYFRTEVQGIGYQLPKYNFSNCLTPVICPKNNAEYLFNKFKDEYNIYLTPCGGANKDRLIRVGHIGNLDISDYSYLLKLMKEEMK